MVQGGNDPPSGEIKTSPSPTPIDEQFNPDLRYTTEGTLGMARAAADTSNTEFFIGASRVGGDAGSLDYSYTLFGMQTTGQSVLQAIEAMPVETTDPFGYLETPLTITSATVFTDTQNGVLMLKAPTDASGIVTVAVTAYDGTNTPTTQTFTAFVGADPYAGVALANPWAAVTPSAPASVQFVPPSGQTATLTNLNNSSPASALRFLVSGVTSGNLVTVYADGVAIGSATATGTAVTVTTDGSKKLFDGAHQITAIQTALNQSATWTDATGDRARRPPTWQASTRRPAALTVFADLQITSTPAMMAVVGRTYTYSVTTNAPSGDSIASIIATRKPSGMTGDGHGNFTWTPTAAQAGTVQPLAIRVTDSLGNTAGLTAGIGVEQAANALLTESSASTVFGQSVTFQATVAAATKMAGTPTGNVTFLDAPRPVPSGWPAARPP